MRLQIVTPEKPLASEEVDDVTVPGIEGEFGVLAGHTTLLTLLGEGPLSYRAGGKNTTLRVAGGFCEVIQDRVTVLADQATTASQ